MGAVRDVVVGLSAVAGAVFVLLAAVGVLRFEDLYSRMHAATKVTTVGIGFVALAAIVGIDGGWSKIVLAFGVVLVTAPAGAQVIARAAADDMPPGGPDWVGVTDAEDHPSPDAPRSSGRGIRS